MMSTQIPWILPLGLKPEEVEHWKMQTPPGMNLAFWALSKGLIAWPKYQQWAMEHYQLSSVHDDYFHEPVSPEFWKLIQSVANWSPNLLPLEEWDGTIFIGCVEPPPANTKWSFPVQFVLASPTSLKLQWQKYQATAPSAAMPEIALPPVPAVSAVPEVSVLPDIPSAPEVPPTTDLKFDMDALNTIVENEAPPPPPQPEMPEGLSFDISSVKKTALNFDLEVTSGPSTPEEMINELTKEPAPTSQALPQEEPENSDVVGALDFSAVTGVTGELPKHEARNPSPSPAANAPSGLDDIHTESETMLWAFNEMKKYFDQSMFLKFENNEFTPVHWSDGWQPKPGAETTKVGIDTPNLFRIVVRTKHLYHGKIVPSPSHQVFFQNWGLASLPEMSTAIPIILRGEIKGMLLSVGPQSSIEGQALHHAEKIANRLQQKWDEITNPGKVA